MEILQRIRKNTFLRQNATLFIGTLTVSILNYLYYPILGRLLNVQDFGEVQVLVSFFLQLMMLLMVLTQVTTNIVANHNNEKEKQHIISSLEKLALGVGLALFIVSSVFSWRLMEALQFQSPWPFLLLLAAFVVTIPFTFRSGYLRGKQKFLDVSLGSAIGAAGKVIASAGLVLIGFGTVGAIGGLVIAQVLALLYTTRQARRWGFSMTKADFWRLPNMKLVAPELRYFGLVLTGSLAITIMYSVDVILVKYYFSPEEAGLYAAVATIARILFFLTVSIAQVLMPAVKLRQTVRENTKLLYRSTLLVSAIGGTALGFLALFPQFVMQGLMGGKYLEYAYLLPHLSLAIFLISLLNLFVIYHLALRHYGVGIVAASGAVITCGLIIANHQSLDQVVNNVLFGSVATLCVFGGWILMRSIKFKPERGQA